MKKILTNPAVTELATTANALFPVIANQDDDNAIFFQSLLDEFQADLDVLQQLKLFHAWCLDQQPTKIKNPRFRFRSWLTNAADYKKRRRANTTPHLYTKTQSQATED